ncbi:MAG TPA: L-lysine 6-transaminase [Acidobacteriota bacterium]|nr:L-lysine 6-transaminase [Acidobacteriota bacterium]
MEEAGVSVTAASVHPIIQTYMLGDGLQIVADLERSQGSRIYDLRSNRTYLDFFSCFATLPLGFNHPQLASPESRERLGKVAVQKPSNSDLYSRELAEFVQSFARAAKPEPMKYLFFIDGGALAVENALKAAFDWKVQKNFQNGLTEERGFQVLHFQDAFHGRSGYTLSLTNTWDHRKTRYFPTFNWPRVLNPRCRFPMEGVNRETVLRDEAESLQQIERLLQERNQDIACVILEPIQCEAGDNHFRPEFHASVRRLCDQYEVLMIYDEVQTGFGTTGKMWAAEHYVLPDIIAFGKKSQVCGIMVSSRIDEVPEHVFKVSSRINSTWGGNLVDMVRCRMILDIYESEDILEIARSRGELLMKELQALEADFPHVVSNARGLGLLCAVDLPDTMTRDRLRGELFEQGVIILGCGPRSIRFRTALNIPEEDLAEGLSRLRKVVARL